MIPSTLTSRPFALLSLAALVALGPTACSGRSIGAESGGSETGGNNTTTTSTTSTETSEATTSESSTTETETETETGADWGESTTNWGGEPCESDEDCEVGGCIEGECVACESDNDCYGLLPIEACLFRECHDSACVYVDYDCELDDPCHVGYCNPDSEYGPACEVEYCDAYDEVVDLELVITPVNFTVSPMLDIGAEVQVVGHRGCDNLDLVRDLDSGELLLMSTRNMHPDLDSWQDDFIEHYGLDWNGLSAPLTIDYIDHGACGIVSDDCGDYSRGNVDLSLGDLDARLLDHTAGWAPGGYFTKVGSLQFGEWDCIFEAIYYGGAFVGRGACVDCPPPTFIAGCEPAADPPNPDNFQIDFEFTMPYRWFNFSCRVISSEAGVDEDGLPQQLRGLDCFPLGEQDLEHSICEH